MIGRRLFTPYIVGVETRAEFHTRPMKPKAVASNRQLSSDRRSPEFQRAWQRSVEAWLTDDERAWLRASFQVFPERRAMATASFVEDAVAELRAAMRCGPPGSISAAVERAKRTK